MLWVLKAADDVTAVKLGSTWRMPAGAEIDELAATAREAGCTWVYKSINGINGFVITCLVNNNRIFHPFAGYRRSYNRA